MAVSDWTARLTPLKKRVIHIKYAALLLVLSTTLSGAACSGDAVPAAAITPTAQAATAVPLFGAASNPVPAVTPTPSADSALNSPANGAPGRVAAAPTYWPTEGWRFSTPEEQGMASELLVRMLDQISTDGFIHSVLVVRNGYVVLDAYFYPHTKDIKHDIADVTNSITSALVGIAIGQGAIEGADQRVSHFFPSVADPDPKKEALTIEHLLTMSSGLSWQGGVNPELNTTHQMVRSGNWVQFVLDRPMSKEPGRVMDYHPGASHLLSAITQKATGMTALSFAEKHLFGPLGIVDVSWASDPQGVNSGGSGVFMTQLDMAKFGYLYLNSGTWDGRELVPSQWVEASTERHSALPYWIPYGYQWWVYPVGPFAAMGQGGQVVFVVPSIDAVVVFTGGIGVADSLYGSQLATKNLLDTFVIPAALSIGPLPENRQAAALLESRTRELALVPERQPSPSLPEIATNVSGKTIGILTHPLRWDLMSLDFDEEEAMATITFRDQRQLEYSIGLDNVFRTTAVENSHGSGRRIAARGRWLDDNTFEFTSVTLGGTHDYRTELTFEGNGVEGTIQVGTGERQSIQFQGHLQD